MASTSANSVAPGMVMTHGLKNMYSLPSAIMSPHDGAGGGMPSPRNESVASSRIACAISKVATTTRALPIFGRISVSENDARRGGADGARGGDIVQRAHLHGGAARHHGKAIPKEKSEHCDDDLKRAADEGSNRKRHQDDRHGEPRGDDEANDKIDASAEIAPKQAKRGSALAPTTSEMREP